MNMRDWILGTQHNV